MEDPRVADYAVLWSEPGWRLWRTPGGRLVPISPDGRVGVDLKAFDDEAFAVLVVERMVSAGVAVSDETPAGIQELPTPPPGEYLMCRLEAAAPAGWDEWAHWVVLDSNGLPVGSIAEHHELISHNTWGPATYSAAHNRLDRDGPSPWHQGGYATPDEASAAPRRHRKHEPIASQLVRHWPRAEMPDPRRSDARPGETLQLQDCIARKCPSPSGMIVR